MDLDYETRPGCPMDSASLIRGLDYVVNGGAPRAQVVNMSIGTPSDLGRATRDALVAAQRAGLVLVGAAGNTQCSGGRDTFVPVSYPAAYPEVWAIGATDPGNGRACYSHVGGELRYDNIGKVGLDHTASGVFVENISHNEVTETSLGVYAEATWLPTDSLRLLAGLEAELHRSRELVAPVHQHPGDTEQHRRVGIVAAGVHLAGYF